MLRKLHTVREVASELGQAASRVEDAYREGDAPYEVDITGRLLGAVVERLDGRSIKGLKWRAKQFKTGRDSAAEEKRVGADFMGVLDIDLDEYSVTKGFLVQAKRAEPRKPIDDWKRLEDQLEKMLAISPASFLFVYSRERGIRAFPAVSVLGLKSRDVFDLYDRSFERFFEEHLECFIGDRELSVPTMQAALSGDAPSERVLYVGATDKRETRLDQW
ncbi:hypothetical protein [Pukyongiella litopenaei]|uniref:Restriction endonuclease n=1 Tax=Pukyongiella litopenaei TaxID=2605946 RepID=A0A2S0MQQ6_9RHOB|nr:hypothetical protein [Pukyongiella litopenaei]AVO38204.2 hypothetical protein C6Y53_11135 [Pukyongiella litopenaei]